MSTVEAPVTKQSRGGWGAKSVAALIIFIIAALLTPVGIVGHWGHRTVMDSESYVETVKPLAENPDLQDAIATTMSDAILQRVDTQSLVSGFLGNLIKDPELNERLSGPLAAGIDGIIRGAVLRFVQSQQFQDLWVALNTSAQRGLVAVLEGGQEGPVRLDGDKVVLSIDSIISAAQQDLVDAGISAAANITLPKTDREVVLFQSAALPQIQFAYRLSAPILQWLPLLLAALFGAAILLARNRARITFLTGLVLVAWAGIIGVVLNIAQGSFTNALAGSPFENAANAFWDTLFRYLVVGLRTVLVLGVVVIIAGWLASKTPPGPKLREGLDRWLGSLGTSVPKGARSFVAEHLLVFRTLAVAIGVVVMSTGNLLSGWHLGWSLLLTLVLFAAVEVVRKPA